MYQKWENMNLSTRLAHRYAVFKEGAVKWVKKMFEDLVLLLNYILKLQIKAVEHLEVKQMFEITTK